MRYGPLVIALVLLTVVPGFVAADIVGSPEIDVTLEDDSVVPGEESALELTITNAGQVREGSNSNQQLNKRVTTARGLTVTVDDDDAPIDIKTETRAVGTLPEGQTSVDFSMMVNESADPGTYEIPVTAEYTHTHIIKQGIDGGEEITISREEEYDVTLEIENDARLTIVDVASHARVGTTGTVAVTAENTGTEVARDTALILESRNTELTLGDSTTASRQIGEWVPGERHTVKYRVTADRTAGPQPYTFDATAEYDDSDGVRQTSETRPLAITPQEEQAFAVESVNSSVVVGDTGTVTVRMRNEGPIPVTDASVKLSSTSPALTLSGSSSASRFAGNWEVGEVRTLEYDLTATDDADTRSYALDATVTYQDKEGDTETAPSRSLGVEPGPEQSFAIEDVTSTLRVGAEGQLTGQVRNTGAVAVENAVVVFETDKPTVTPIETEVPVGDLAAGEAASFSLPVEISESADPGPQQYSLVVQYRNGDGDQRTSDTIDVRTAVGPDDGVFSLDTEGTTVAPGEGTVLEITVTNEGDERLTDISANMFADAPLSVEDDEAFIASLGPGESKTVTFSVDASGNALTKEYPVSLDFQYDEPDGDTKLSDTHKVAVSVKESDSDGGFSLPLLVGGLLVVGLGSVYVYRH